MNRIVQTVLPICLLVFSGDALGAPPKAPFPKDAKEPSLQAYLRDLSSSESQARLFAARELRRQVRWALRVTSRDDGTSLSASEGWLMLEDFDRSLAPVCIAGLNEPNISGPCASILGLLETESALPALQESLRNAPRMQVRRKTQRAINNIQAAMEEGS